MALKWTEAFKASPSGFLGRKVKIICGSCSTPSTSKLGDCIFAQDHDHRITAFCPTCGTWNLTDLAEA